MTKKIDIHPSNIYAGVALAMEALLRKNPGAQVSWRAHYGNAVTVKQPNGETRHIALGRKQVKKEPHP